MTMQPPNILFITSHDTGHWLGCYGQPNLRTPCLDAMAQAGCRFSHSFATAPVCTPSRGAMMTGRYPQTNGLMGLIQPPYRWRLNRGERHLSDLLAERGYRTLLFNHQHEAHHDEPLGFDEMRLHDTGAYRLLTGEHVATADQTADALLAFFSETKDTHRPFYAQVGFFETHTPFDWNGAEPDLSLGLELPPQVADTPANREHVAALRGSIQSLDRAMGKILRGLAQTGLDRRTLVVFTVDHGVELPRCKWTLYDGGLATALLMQGPPELIRPGGVCPWLVSNVDLLPSLLQLAGLPPAEGLQGLSFADWFDDPQAPAPRDRLFGLMHGNDRWVESRCIRTERHKLIRNFSASRTRAKPDQPANTVQVERPVVELYDLHEDPHELHDLGRAPTHQPIRQQLSGQLLSWLESVEDPILQGPIRTPYYEMAIADLSHDVPR
jgi:arylsulfatase A-like enzyme